MTVAFLSTPGGGALFSRNFTTNLAQQCTPFSRALKIDTNDLCMIFGRLV